MSINCEHCPAGREPFSDLCPRDPGKAPAETRRRSLAKSEALYWEGETPQSVFILHRGLIKLYRGVKPGRQATVRLVRPGEIFGYTSLLCGAPYSLSAEALLDSELCVFSAASFIRSMAGPAAFTRGLLESTARELRSARMDLATRCDLDAAGKIAGRLLEFGGQEDAAGNPDSGALRITRTVLGEMSGSAQETVSRVLGRLEAAGLIKRKGRAILIKDREGLRSLAQG